RLRSLGSPRLLALSRVVCNRLGAEAGEQAPSADRLGESEQVDETGSRLPVAGRVQDGRLVVREQADEDLADDSAADRAEAVPALPCVGLAKDVVPERRLAAPPGRRHADFVRTERPLAECSGDCLARGKTD